MVNEYEGRTYPPQVTDPLEIMGFNVGLWRCLVVLASMTVLLRGFSLLFLKLLISKFQ